MKRTLLYIGLNNDSQKSLEKLASTEGWEVDAKGESTDTWLTLLKEKKHSIVVIDSDVGDIQSLDIGKMIRSLTTEIGIIFLSERHDEINLIVALEIGADNYIYKPISPRVLLAYCASLLRRLSTYKKFTSDTRLSPSEQLNYGALQINPETREVTLDQQKIVFSSSEFDLLYLLASNAGQILSRQNIMKDLRGIEYNGIDRSIDLKISRLRKRLNDDPDNPKRIKTIRGKGYLFNRYAW